jgi:hypothetical protein
MADRTENYSTSGSHTKWHDLHQVALIQRITTSGHFFEAL